MTAKPSRAKVGLLTGAALLAAIGVATPAVAHIGANADTGSATVAGSTPVWATPQADTGHANPNQVRHVQVALALRDPGGAAALASSVATPGSPQHGHFLSPQQFTDRFAASEDTVNSVRTWLHAQGLGVQGVTPNRHFIDVTATNKQLSSAFDVNLDVYRHRGLDGTVRQLVAPSSAISVPTTLRSAISTVIGLDDSASTVSPGGVFHRTDRGTSSSATSHGSVHRSNPAAVGQPHCARFWGEQNNTDVPQKYGDGNQSNSLCGYNNAQMRSIYGLSASNTGAGAQIGIVGAFNSDSIVADTNRAAADNGAPALSANQYTTVPPAGGYVPDPGCGGPDSWASEQSLDVQSSHTMAPAAHINYYAASNCKGLYGALNTAIQDNKVGIISNSWLFPDESSVSAAERNQLQSLVVQAAVQGQTVLFCSGDAGNNSTAAGKPVATWPASNPWVTAVGGTSVALDSSGKQLFTTGWEGSGNTLSGGKWNPLPDNNGHFAGGAGGGTSMLYETPDYQKKAVPSGGHRAVPDISALADAYTGMSVGFTSAEQGGYVEYASGGTSLATPVIAGLVADGAQHAKTDRFGFLNPNLYGMNSSALRDVTPHKAGIFTPNMASYGYVPVPSAAGSYLIDTDSKPQNLQSAQGWDPVTGLGTPTGGFIAALGR